MTQIEAVVFDLGGVLIDWNPRYLYRKIFSDDNEMEYFLREICSLEWNERQDEGRDWALAVTDLSQAHPNYREQIFAYHERWTEMIKGEFAGTVEVLKSLKAKGLPLFALSNWSEEKFPYALSRFDFLRQFNDILLSGRERLKKPDSRFYRLLIERHALDPSRTVFIDDLARNTEAAEKLGFQTVHFRSPDQLREALAELGLLRVCLTDP